jgi:hypothetical protein
MVAQAIVYEFCASGAIERSIETVKDALAERCETLATRCARAAGGPSSSPGGRLLHVGDAAPRAPTSTRCSPPPPSAGSRS